MCHPAEVLEMTKFREERKQPKQLGVIENGILWDLAGAAYPEPHLWAQ